MLKVKILPIPSLDEWQKMVNYTIKGNKKNEITKINIESMTCERTHNERLLLYNSRNVKQIRWILIYKP